MRYRGIKKKKKALQPVIKVDTENPWFYSKYFGAYPKKTPKQPML